MKKTVSLLALLFPFALTGCQSAGLTPALVPESGNSNAMPDKSATLSGQYLFKLKPQVPNTAETLEQLHHAFESQSVQSIQPIGNAWYLLILNIKANPDPSFAVIQQLAEHSGLIETVQPNLPYGINPPKKPAFTGNGS